MGKGVREIQIPLHLKKLQISIMKLTSPNNFIIMSKIYLTQLHNNFTVKGILYNKIIVYHYFIFQI